MVAFQHTCPKCGTTNQAGSVFCYACGHSLQAAAPLASYPVAGAALGNLTGLLPGHHLLKQRYRILRQLGKGGFGAVYKAEDIQFSNRLLAIKEMSQSGQSSQELAEATDAFSREALMLAGLRHQNLPRIYDYFSDGGRWYLAMDYIEGETVSDHLDKVGGHLPVEKALQIGIQLCTVLDYLHTRQPPIIFRDLKPDNIMLTPDGHLYLIDFGIARLFKPGQAKDTIAYGSAGYTAPEQYGRAQTTPQSDIYSLGAVLHLLLSGHDPSTNTPNPFTFLPLPKISPELESLIEQMVQMIVTNRPASIIEVKQKLQRIADQSTAGKMGTLQPNVPYMSQPSGVSSPNIPPAQPTPYAAPQPFLIQQPNPLQRHSSKRAVFLAGLILLIVGSIILFSFSRTTQGNTADGNTTTAAADATAAIVAANPLPSYFSRKGTLALYDPLQGPSQWSENSDTSYGGTCQFNSGAYHISQSKPGFYRCISSAAFSNFAFEVQMTIVQGDCGGMVFRVANGYYYFSVCQDRTYTFLKVTAANGTVLQTPSPDNSSIYAGLNQANLIAVMADGNTITLYVNNIQIASVQDSDFPSGNVGLVAGFENNSTEVVFRNARVWTL